MSDRRVMDGEVYDAKRRAREIVAEAEAVREAARAEGYAAGVEAARAELASRIASVIRERTELERGVVAEASAVAVEIARRIVRRELKESAATVSALVAELLAAARRRDGIEIRVNPADADSARAAAEGARVVEDASIECGGCLVSGRTFKADARVETQLARLAEALNGGR